ncbi:hypothetical protein N665_0640s0005 [Sinapis alba]|nr:hypothetical protein N665_0640s0005 [Sinapis alba]
MTITNLPRDLVEEILYRVPVKSIGAVRSTCKIWNVLCKDERFANKHIDKASASREKEYLMISGVSRAICIAREHSDDQPLDISQVFVSNGLLLCIWRLTTIDNRSRLLVWNPYWGKRRWIEYPTYCWTERFAFGYDKSCNGCHKILRLRSNNSDRHMDIYDVSSDSWRTLDATFERLIILFIEHGFSLKGNTYFESQDRFLHCFDFTRERFGPRLPLPWFSHSSCPVFLSSIKEEKLAVLISPWRTFGVDIWVTSKIEDPYVVSWSKFFKVKTETIQHIDHGFRSGHFLIDLEKKVTVVFDMHGEIKKSYIICANNGHVREVDLRQWSGAFQLVGCYVPSSVQI